MLTGDSEVINDTEEDDTGLNGLIKCDSTSLSLHNLLCEGNIFNQLEIQAASVTHVSGPETKQNENQRKLKSLQAQLISFKLFNKTNMMQINKNMQFLSCLVFQ